jgi:quinol monooxygenase YgiN
MGRRSNLTEEATMYLLMQHTVRDYDDWKPVFDGGEQVRTRHGCTGYEIYRDDDEANDVTVMLDFPSREAGEAFLADPDLHQRMDEAGVLSKPRTTWVTQTQCVNYRERKAV